MPSVPLGCAVSRLLACALICAALVAVISLAAKRQQAAGPLSRTSNQPNLQFAAPSEGGIKPAGTTIMVNSLSDVANGTDGLCTLREAISAANANLPSGAVAGECAAGGSGTDTIALTGLTGTIDVTQQLEALQSSVNIDGPGANLLTIQRSTAGGTPDFSVFVIALAPSETYTLSRMTISNGRRLGGNDGGGIAMMFTNSSTINIVDCVFTGNTASRGAGIFNQNPGTLNVINSTFTNNVTPGDDPAHNQGGAGIWSVSGTVNIINSTFSNNTAALAGIGGGFLNFSGTATVTNSTFSNNSATHGGGIYTGANGGTMDVNNCTIVRNTATMRGGGVFNGDTFRTRNSIIALNTGSIGPDFNIVITSQGHNIIGVNDGSGVTPASGDMIGTSGSPIDPMVGPLQNNGGSTQTIALLPGSPALDAGDDCVAQPAHCGDSKISQLFTDQRGSGFARSVDGPDIGAVVTPDIGAYEMQTPLADLTDTSTNEDTQLIIPFDGGDTSTITSVTATSSNSALVPNDVAHLSAAITGSTGSVTINPFLNQFGTTNITVTVNRTGGPESKTFMLTVNPVNDPPAFTKGPDQAINEDAGAQNVGWATAISPGPAASGESSQTVTFQITGNTNSSLFSIGPSISPGGVLTYTPVANAVGSATITVNLQDNGGTANGGVDTSPSQTFTITVNSVNDAPSFTKGPDQTVNEDAGAQTVNNWATNLSAGPANESSQTLSFQITANTNAALFSAGPAVSSTGTLTYTPVANAGGSSTITLVIKDNGGTANGGVDTSASQSFTISVNAVNDVPSFTKGANQTVDEDAGAQTVNNWATSLSAGPPDESGQTLSFQITNNTNAGLFSSAPAVSSNGTLTYTPAANVNGSATITLVIKDDGGTANGGVDTSASQTFTITVNAINDAPSFTKGTDQTVNEDAGAQTVNNWATNLSAGPANESGQTLSFQITNNTNTSLFSAGPAVSSAGTLTYTPAANANGSATITLVIKDTGGTANGGVDTSASQTFTITVNAINDAPSFTKGTDQTVNEDAGAQTVNNWPTNLSAGPANESGQTLSFQITNNTNTSLFSAGPAVSSAGTLTYTPAANANGSATITLVIKDDGGTANGGVDTSASQTFTITVNAINDVPSFTKGTDQTVNEDAGAQTVNNWATNLSAGPANESGQTLSFQITNNTNTSLFSAGPAVSSAGTLTYTPAANANGSATITLVIKDTGGTANGGVDTSASQTFTITVNAINDAPSFTKGTDQTVNEDAGAQTVNNWATSIFAGSANESGQTVSFNITGNTNAALFSAGPAVSSTGTLTYTPAADANGSATITLVIKDDGGTANGGVDTSAAQTFTITVNPVNDVPSFTNGADQTVNNNAGAQTVTNWATGISAGPANESAQTLTFQITNNSSPSIFSAGPAVSSTGTLTYTPAANATGTATITINLRDNGGTANGGVDTSASQTFNITTTAAGGTFNFSSATYNTTESAGFTNVTVNRTGDLSRAVTVDYASSGNNGLPCSTANGVATPKCDFTTALGTLNFGAGENSKTVTILISQDSFVEGPETFTVSLSNPTNNSALGTTSTATTTIADDVTEPGTNAIDDVRNFVRQHYHDFLNREPDQSGWDFWTNQITSCGNDVQCNEVSHISVSASFFLSIEFQQTGYLVERFYKVAYGDATGNSTFVNPHTLAVPIVRANEFLTDTQRIGRGVIVLQPGWEQLLESNKQAYALEFVQTTRFVTALPTTMTPAQFVDKLNQNSGGPLTLSERQAAIDLFGGAGNSSNLSARAQAVRMVADDQTLYDAEFNRAFVLTEYIGYLRRNPNDAPDSDYTGYEFWLTKLNQFNGNYINAEMVKSFLSSIEYRQRFGP